MSCSTVFSLYILFFFVMSLGYWSKNHDDDDDDDDDGSRFAFRLKRSAKKMNRAVFSALLRKHDVGLGKRSYFWPHLTKSTKI